MLSSRGEIIGRKCNSRKQEKQMGKTMLIIKEAIYGDPVSSQEISAKRSGTMVTTGFLNKSVQKFAEK